MYTKTIRLILGGLLAVAMLAPAAASAAGNIHVGKITVLPRVAYTGEWNDNIYISDKDEKSDYISKYTVGLGILRETDPDNYFKLGYGLDVFQYSDYNDNDYEAHNAYAGIGYKAPAGLYVKLDERFVSTEDPYGGDNLYKEGVAKTKRWNNTINAAVGYEFADRFRIEASYRNFVEKYHEFVDEWQNKVDHEPGVALFYRFMPKTSALVEYRVQMREYTEQQSAGDNDKGATSDTAQDFTYHKAFVGLHWDASAKINGDLKVGIGFKDYENDENWESPAQDYDDATTWIAETKLSYKMLERTVLNGRLMRQVKDSTSAGSTRYTDTVFGVGARQMLTDKLTGTVDLSYTYDDYDDDREDDTYLARLGLDYQIQDWLTAGVNYSFKQRESNADDKDYTNNRIAFTVGAAF